MRQQKVEKNKRESRKKRKDELEKKSPTKHKE